MRAVGDAELIWDGREQGVGLRRLSLVVFVGRTHFFVGTVYCCSARFAIVWLAFIRSPEALEILKRYGFRPYLSGRQDRD